MVSSNRGQNEHHKISKQSESTYEIEALKTQGAQHNSVHDVNRKEIVGDENNLIVIIIRYDGCVLGEARFLVHV